MNLKDSHNRSLGTFFFREIKRIPDFKINKLKCLKKFVRTSEFYDKKEKLHDRDIAALFNQFSAFLVRKTKKKQNIFKYRAVLKLNKVSISKEKESKNFSSGDSNPMLIII
ncbi:hypothetical protein [Flavobacterium panacagri]|uniref:hypothetical protein n=1 Tax=Flavobacterium panacagri TaxID=3034146 RepID=UPI0025A5482A|nr:hypothetical protein [Flavobacterium panacagri]